MANSTEEDYYGNNAIGYLFLFAFSAIILAGLMIQLFIVAINVIDWLRGRLITGADKIITSIGISRIFFYTAFLFSWFTFSNISTILIVFTIESSSFSNIWLSTLLSIFFYFKISTFRNMFFLRLQAIISRRVTYLIIASMLFSVTYVSMCHFTPMFFRNSTQDDISYQKEEQIRSYVGTLWAAFPLLIFFKVLLLLISLLGLHIRRMNNHGNVTSGTDIYHRTMKFTIISFLLCAFFIILILFQICTILPDNLLVFVMMSTLPILHSVLLIYVTTKLKKQFFKIIHCGTNCLSNRNSPGPRSREPMEVTPL